MVWTAYKLHYIRITLIGIASVVNNLTITPGPERCSIPLGWTPSAICGCMQ
jgi:hypothetical protein